MIDGRKMNCKMPVKLLFIFMVAAMLLVLQATAGYAAENGGLQGEEKIFKDVSLTDANAPYIKFLFEKGLMTGYPDGSFGPGRPLTRAEAVIVLAKGAGIKPVTSAVATFRDTGPGHWAYGYIEAAVKAGILSGYPDGTFRPDAQLSRAETMALLIKWSKQDTPDVSLTIKDVAITNWAYKAVCTAVDANFIALPADGNFNPDQAITRRDFARGTTMTMALSPAYNAVSLKGELVVKKGSLKVKTAAGEQTVTDRLTLQEGMQINTSPGCDAEIVFDDGSGIKIMENTEIILRKMGGLQTIRKDGMPITAIDNVDIKLNSGKIFGALASKYDSQQNKENKDNKEDKSKLIASTELTPELYKSLLALEQPKSSQQQLPWYKVASTKKVKVTVDMPWGVAAVRGTFWSNEVGLKELITSVLNGEMTLTTTGGQTVTISGGQMTTVDSAGGPPTPPAPMPPEVAQVWQALQDWVTQRAEEIQNNQLTDFEAPPGDLNNEQAPATEQLQTLVQTLSDAIDNAISNTNTSISTNTSSGNGSGSNTTVTITSGTIQAMLMSKSGSYLDQKTINFYLGTSYSDEGTFIGSGVTGADGIATCVLTNITMNYTPGQKYYVIAKFAGDGTYDASKSSVLPYSNTDLMLTINPSTMVSPGDTVTAEVVLTNNGNALPGQNVKLYDGYPPNGYLIATIQTNTNGLATYDLTSYIANKGESFNIYAEFEGSNSGTYYTPAGDSCYISVSDSSSSIYLNDVSIAAASIVNLSGHLTNTGGNPISAEFYLIPEGGSDILFGSDFADSSGDIDLTYDIFQLVGIGHHRWKVTVQDAVYGYGDLTAEAALNIGVPKDSYVNALFGMGQVSLNTSLLECDYTPIEGQVTFYIDLNNDNSIDELTESVETVGTDYNGFATCPIPSNILDPLDKSKYYLVKAVYAGSAQNTSWEATGNVNFSNTSLLILLGPS
ncbi:MAG: hypothetical protein VR69_17590 [Peptococcaceae bacterium BRH_c4b]|nr:MAG: hypothetical protein VR69_17590 [Peptococcaceae bacterium BRH_c4b]